MSQKRKITDKNLYEFLEVVSSATEQELKKAYRKKALKCHPDKNPDNPKAAELFHELSEALEILLDEKAREAYDRTLKAKELAKERIKVLDSKRRKFREDLDRREQAAREAEKERQAAKRKYTTSGTNLSEEELLQKEVERLRKEGSRALQEEQELVRLQILKEQQGKFSFVSAEETSKTKVVEGPRIKIKWAKGASPRSYDTLMQAFSKYGKVTTLVVGKKCAIIEFQSQIDAERAYDGESTDDGVKLEWLSEIPKTSDLKSGTGTTTTTTTTTSTAFPASESASTGGTAQTFSNINPPQPMNVTNFADFEAMILGKLSAAAAAQKQNSVAPSSPVPSSATSN